MCTLNIDWLLQDINIAKNSKPLRPPPPLPTILPSILSAPDPVPLHATPRVTALLRNGYRGQFGQSHWATGNKKCTYVLCLSVSDHAILLCIRLFFIVIDLFYLFFSINCCQFAQLQRRLSCWESLHMKASTLTSTFQGINSMASHANPPSAISLSLTSQTPDELTLMTGSQLNTLISSPLPTTSQSRQSLTQATRLVRYAQANRSVTALLTYSEILEYVGIFNNTKLATEWQKEVEHQQSNQAEATLWTQVSLFYVNFISSYNMDRLLCLILAWSTHCYLFSCPLLAIMFPWTDLWASQDL